MMKALSASTCLAAVSFCAALAISPMAVAQDNGASQKRHEQSGSQPTNKEVQTETSKPKSAPSAERHGAEKMQTGETGATEKAKPEMKKGDAAEQQRPEKRSGEAAQEKKGGAKMTTGRAAAESGGTMRLDHRQAADFRSRLGQRGETASLPSDFAVRAGVALPETVRLLELPPEIFVEYPQFRGYDYIVFRNEIIIIDPRTREIVDVISG